MDGLDNETEADGIDDEDFVPRIVYTTEGYESTDPDRPLYMEVDVYNHDCIAINMYRFGGIFTHFLTFDECEALMDRLGIAMNEFLMYHNQESDGANE